MPGPQRDVRRSDVLDVMKDHHDPHEPWKVSELAEALSCSESTVYSRLRELKTLGKVRTKSFGASARAWWLAPGAIEDDDEIEAMRA